MNDWVSLASSWLPFLFLIGLWFWFSRKSGMQARSSPGATIIELYEQQVAKYRRMNGFLERIAASLGEAGGSGGPKNLRSATACVQQERRNAQN